MTYEQRTVRVVGVVQGVGFRAWMRSRSRALGLAGWVRNEPDGSVRALIGGEAEKLAAMLELLRRGPPGADVTRIEAEDAEEGAAPEPFEIRY